MTSTFLTWYSLPSICIAIISQYGFGRSIHCKIYIANYKPTIPLTDFKSNHHIWKWKVKVKSLSCFWLFVAPWTVACQIPPCMESSRSPQVPLFMESSWQGYWSGLPFPSPGDVPDQGIKPGSPTVQADTTVSHQGSPYFLSTDFKPNHHIYGELKPRKKIGLHVINLLRKPCTRASLGI